MKKLITFIMITFAIFANAEKIDPGMQLQKELAENQRLCEICKAKIKKYKEQDRTDQYAKKTLATYEKRHIMYCGEKFKQ